MTDSAEIDAAVIAALTSDGGSPGGSPPGLLDLCPDGIFMDVAPAGKTRFVIVSVILDEDVYAMGSEAYEKVTYLIKAVQKSTSGAEANAAAARIHAVMQDVELTGMTGYQHMRTEREERVRFTEVDDVDADVRWQHRGGRYAVFVSPTM